MRNNSLKRKIIFFVIIILTPITTSSVISLSISKKINQNYNFMLSKISTTNEISNDISNSYYNFNKYILSNTKDCKAIYENSYNKAVSKIEALDESSDVDSRYILRDLKNSMKSYKTAGDVTFSIYDNQEGIDVYYNYFVYAKESASFCDNFIAKLSDSYLSYNDRAYTKLKQKEKFIYEIITLYITLTLLMSIIYSLFFIRNISDKLKELVQASQRVSKRDFTYRESKNTNIYELDILSEAFKTMIFDIKKYIYSIKENAELEKKLNEEELNILKYQNALKLSQLKVLQSQINPHFLFNTLNCVNQTAIKENAVQTEELIKSVSGILRYSLSMMDKFATLEEEVNLIKQYIFIQKVRYDDRISFNLNILGDLSKVLVPGMTLQPFVENAFIHGIEPKEEGGTINITISEKDEVFLVLIEDDGCGIERQLLNKIIEEDIEQEHIGHTTGMGIKSVVKRLELMYEREDIFSIESIHGVGTKITLKLPLKEWKNIC